MLIRQTLLHVQEYLEKSTFASDAESETGQLLSEVRTLIDRIDTDSETLGLKTSSAGIDSLACSRNAGGGIPAAGSMHLTTPPAGPIVGTQLKTRANARFNRSMTVASSSRPNLNHLLGHAGGSSRSPSTGTHGTPGAGSIVLGTPRDEQSQSQSQSGSGGSGGQQNNTSFGDSLLMGSGVVPTAASEQQAGQIPSVLNTTKAEGMGDDGEGVFFEDTPQSDSMPDDDVAAWLNKNFADTHDEREETGFDIPLLRRESTAANLVSLRHGSSIETAAMDGSEGSDSPTNNANASNGTTAQNVVMAGSIGDSVNLASGNPADKSSSSRSRKNQQDEDELNANALQSENGPSTIKYTRSHERKNNARESARRTRKFLADAGVEDLSAIVHSPDFDIFALLDEYTAACKGDRDAAAHKVFVTVCCNVFFYYSFVLSLDMDVAKLVQWFHKTCELYGKNPYHNAVHAADVLQTVHIFLLTSSVYQFFSDPEIFAVLFAAASHDIGHLGTNNLFLQNISHPVAVLYNDQSVQENFHTALAFHLLSTSGTDFLAASTVWSDGLHRDFRGAVIDCLWGTDMKQHATLMQSASSILEDGVIEDSEVPALLRAIVHAADLSNPLKQWSVYMEWAARVVGEFWRQGDEESKRGAKISPMCDRNGANFAKAQKGFIDFVVKPWMKTLEAVLPPIWLVRMEENLLAVGNMAQQEIDDMHVRITAHAATPLDDTVAQRVMEALRSLVTPRNNGSLRWGFTSPLKSLSNRKKSAAQQEEEGVENNEGGTTATGAVTTSSSSSPSSPGRAPVKRMADMSESEIVERLRAQWSDIIKGLTSRGSLSHNTAIEQWARILIEAHSATPFLQLDADSAIMTSLAAATEGGGSADTARAVLEKLKPSDFREPFSFVRTLSLTILDMTRPVIRSVSPSNRSPYNLLPRGTGPSAVRGLVHSTPGGGGSHTPTPGGGTVFVDHDGNRVSSHHHHHSNNNHHHHQQQQQQQPTTVFLSSETAERGGMVRFFSEDRPVVVPLEAKYGGGAGGRAAASTPDVYNSGTPSRNLMTPQ